MARQGSVTPITVRGAWFWPARG